MLVVSRHELVRAGVLAVLGGMPDLEVRAARLTPASLTWADVALYDAVGPDLSPGELDLLVNQPPGNARTDLPSLSRRELQVPRLSA